MNSRTYCKSGWLCAAMLIMVITTMCAVLGLTACGNNAEQSTSSGEASTSETSSGETSSEASSVKATKSYTLAKTVVNRNNGVTQTETFSYDDRGRQLGSIYEESNSDSPFKDEFTATDWDEFGHILKGTISVDNGSNGSYTETIELANDLNQDGILIKQTETHTVNKDSFEENETASQTQIRTVEYGTDYQVIRKYETKTDCFDQSGTLTFSATVVEEFDENGWQTSYTSSATDNEGNSGNTAAKFEWTKDADGKPTALKMTLSSNDEPTQTATADVTVDESGLLSQVNNLVVDGENYSTTMVFERKEMDSPLPNTLEGWKSFAISHYILS